MKMEPLDPPEIPPAGAKQIGVTPFGKVVWELTTKRGKSVPVIDEKTGEQKRKMALNGVDALHGIRKLELFDKTETFYLESQGNGNMAMIAYRMPTPEELEADERRQRAAAMKETFFEAMVAEGLTTEEMFRRLKGEAPAEVEPPVADRVDTDYPIAAPGVGRWELSNGDIVTGKRVDAEEAEGALAETTTVPEF